MAVDIKQLRIGSHVEVNGVRARVIELVEKHLQNHPWAMYAATIDGEYRTCGGFLQDAEPIAITPEVLVELGFEKIEVWAHYSVFLKDDIEIEVGIVRERVYVKHKQGVLRDVKYLHNLEAFIFITLGKELIEE